MHQAARDEIDKENTMNQPEPQPTDPQPETPKPAEIDRLKEEAAVANWCASTHKERDLW